MNLHSYTSDFWVIVTNDNLLCVHDYLVVKSADWYNVDYRSMVVYSFVSIIYNDYFKL